MKQSSEFFDILIGAIKRETEAFNYYYGASEKSPSPESKSLLTQLAEEERRHRTILVQEYKNLKRLLSGKSKDVFVEEERVSYHLPEEPIFKRVQSLKSVDLAVVCLPTELVGGDFFDTFVMRDANKMGLFLFDVMGHGWEATELKAKAKTEWSKLKELYLEKEAQSILISPSAVMTQLNQLLLDECQRLASFLSLFYTVLDLSKNRLIYASAGHEPPILFSEEKHVNLLEADLLLGIDKDKSYGEGSVEIHAGDILVMFTDGVAESQNARDEEFSRENLIRVVEENKSQNAGLIGQHILTTLKDFMGGKPLTDEFTLAVAKIGA